MINFLLRRLLIGLVVTWIVVTIVFVMFFVTPNNPARLIAGRGANATTLAEVTHTLWLDRPVVERYGHFLDLTVHGQLLSYRNNVPVVKLMAAALPVDLSLLLGAAILWMALGFGIGVFAARHPRTIADRSSTAFVLFFLSLPTFELGLILLYVAFYLPRLHGVNLFPPPGYVPLSDGILGWAHALILPWITMALTSAAVYARLTRASVLEVLGEDYILAARAKGITERRIVYRHALRSALTPVLSQFGVDIATAFSGLVVTEQVFGLNGIGRLAVTSVVDQDLPVIIGTVVLAALFVTVTNIVVDLLYGVIDPRVRTAGL